MLKESILTVNKDEEFIVIINSENGSYFKIDLNLYNIVKDMYLEYNFTKENYIYIIDEFYTFEDDEDRDMLISVIDDLFSYDFINNKNSLIESISICITNNCNLNCKHCCMNSSKNSYPDLSTDDLKKLLCKIVSLNPKSIMISGGEPMYRNDFIEISIFLRKIFKKTMILSTNGTLIKKDNIEIISKIYDEFEVSIDGINEETCRIVRGKNIFNLVKNNIIELKKCVNGKKVFVSMVFGEKNYKYRSDFIKLNNEMGTIPHERALFNVGRTEKNDIMEKFYSKENIDYYIPDDFFENMNISGASCKAGYKTIFINYNGDVYPCPSLINSSFLLGNILDKKEIILYEKNCYEKIFSINITKNSLYNKCNSCDVRYFCWTCPAELYELCKNNNSIIKKCRLLKNILNKEIYGG